MHKYKQMKQKKLQTNHSQNCPAILTLVFLWILELH